MKIDQIYTGCLAEAAYYIESEGEAVIIDPLREYQPYLDRAKEDDAQIKYIFETHFHADFVSGHLDLARKTGATIVYGPGAKADFDLHVAKDEEIFEVGKVKIKVLHTPGHTMESSTYLLIDKDGQEHSIFTGDTLFIGDVGRPDLAVKSDLSERDLAALLFDSLRNKIMTLPDSVVVYPGHGAGSACGKNMSKETFDTLGSQKKLNYALRADMTKEEFIAELLDGLLPPPQYFPKNAVLNKQGYASFDKVLEQGLRAWSAEKVEQALATQEVLLLDVRDAQEFAAGFIPGSLNIGLNGSFAVWVGTLIESLAQPILLVAPQGKEEEAVLRLARVGYDNSIGYLEGGFETWKRENKEVESISSISAEELKNLMANGAGVPLIDVRKAGEFEAESVKGAINLPLAYLMDNLESIDKEQKTYLHCAGGYRSMIAVSLLRQQGFRQIIDIAGGMAAIKKSGIEVSEYVCPNSLKVPG